MSSFLAGLVCGGLFGWAVKGRFLHPTIIERECFDWETEVWR